ncbi:MAG: serine protease [Myxococcales bacterium]|jgi:S1-C subfamily serine protease
MRIRVATVLMLSFALGGCARRTDITDTDSEVEEWVAEQRAEERGLPEWRENTQSASSGSSRPLYPEQAPPPRRAPSSRRGGAPAGSSRPASNREAGELVGLGTCFAVDGQGTIVTAQHVIDGADSVAVIFPGEDPLEAHIVQASPRGDVAVLSVNGKRPAFLPLARPHNSRVGMAVFTMGFPALQLLGAEPKFTDGSISALSGVGDGQLMQISVPIQPGNSGGPLVTDRGDVVGVTIASAALKRFVEVTGSLPQNVNFASKTENLLALLPEEPARAPRTSGRDEAIARATQSVCIVVTRQRP